MTENLENKINENLEFQEIIHDLTENPAVQEMKKYRQHFSTSCYNHCYLASYYCYNICKALKLDYASAARGAMLHDLFLYDWREKGTRSGLHAFTHGKTAYENASKFFELNKVEKDMIIKHMWPVTIALPKYPQTLILTFVDKYCAIKESFEDIFSEFSIKKVFRYSYIFLALIIFKRK